MSGPSQNTGGGYDGGGNGGGNGGRGRAYGGGHGGSTYGGGSTSGGGSISGDGSISGGTSVTGGTSVSGGASTSGSHDGSGRGRDPREYRTREDREFRTREDRPDPASMERRRSASPDRPGRPQPSRGRDQQDFRSKPQQRPADLASLPASVPTPVGAKDLPYPVFQIRGTAGEEFSTTSNHHLIRCLPTNAKPIYQYDLKITVPEDSRHKDSSLATTQQRARILLKKEVLEFFGEDYVFDGVSLLWSPHLIIKEGGFQRIIVAMEQRRDGKPNNMEIALTHQGRLNVGSLANYMLAGRIELNPAGNATLANPIKWLQAVFRKDPASRLVTRPNSNAYFDRSPQTTMALKSTAGVLEARRGAFQTMQIRFGKLTMNIDTATTPFWVPNTGLVVFAAALMGTPLPRLLDAYRASPARFRVQCAKMNGIYFTVKHLGEKGSALKLKMRSLTNANATDTTFEERNEDGSTSTTSVQSYFERKYRIRLAYPQLPLAKTTKGEFPLELCYSAHDERYKEILQGSETADFIKFATAPATVRKTQIEHCLRLLAHDKNSTLAAHGLVMEPRALMLQARLLPPPRLTYGLRKNMSPRDGSWNLRGLHFYRPSTIKSWALVYLPSFKKPQEQAALVRFGNEMVKIFRSCGMIVPAQGPAMLLANADGNMPKIVEDACGKARSAFGADPTVIFFILQGASTQIYQVLKMGLDVKKGIASQVMLEDKALNPRGTAQYLANIAMKVNVKLGGTNCYMNEPMFSTRRFMLVGGDIAHASAVALRSPNPPPSCAALVGTWDKECTAYTAVTGMQEATLAKIAMIRPMFAELLRRYTEQNADLYPQSIIYYRDGVSESEFDAIKNDEGRAMKNLLEELKQQVKITVIVGIKRHHTRFFQEGKHATRLGNVPCGTVVENSSDRNDAYIVAHSDLQGTKRPTRYATVVDENGLSPDVFQRLTLYLCSTYARATRSVAVCPPIYYADQACERGRLHLQKNKDGTLFLGPVHPNLKWNMWWQ